MRTDEFSLLLDRLLPEALEPLLRRILGPSMPRTGEGDRYRILSAGRFSGALVGDVLTQAGNQETDGALVLMEDDVVRVLYFESGRVTGAMSNVLFERLGRILGQAGVLTPDDATEVVEEEESRGLEGAVSRLPPDAAAWGLDRRIREIACALYLMHHGHYVFVEGPPALGDVPRIPIAPVELAMAGLRRYDEWRHRSGRSDRARERERESEGESEPEPPSEAEAATDGAATDEAERRSA